MSKSSQSNRRFGAATLRSLLQAAGIVAFLAAAVYAGLHWERNSVIGEIRFTGYHFTPEEALQQAVVPPIGMHPDSVDFAGLIEAYRKLPWVREAGVRVEPGGRLVVDLQERQPLALLASGSERRLVDRDGVKIPMLLKRRVNVPILHGFSSDPIHEPLAGEAFGQVRDFLLAARRSRLAWATISEVGWSREEGVVALSHENGVRLVFGRDGFEEKVTYWDGFYESVVAEQGIRNFSTVDLRFRNQIVTR